MKRPTRASSPSTLPRVNLLSPWVFEAIATRRLRRRFTVMAGIVVLLIGAGWAVQHLRAGQAEQVLAVENAETKRLTDQADELAPVRSFVLTVEAQKLLVREAMRNEVFTSRVLGGLDDAAPGGVKIETITVTVAPPAGEEDPAVATEGESSPCPGPDPFNTRTVVGCITLAGTADSRASVGDLVVNLGDEPLFVEPFISTTTTAEGDEVLFTGSVGLSEKAYSRRYDDIDRLLASEATR